MKKIILLFVCVAAMLQMKAQNTPDAVLSKITDDISGKLLSNAKTVFTLIDLSDNKGKTTDLGRYLTEKLSMIMSKKSISFKIIDKTYIKKALTDKGIAESKYNDIFSVKDICAGLGIQVVITGTIVSMSTSYDINIKALDVTDASLITSGFGSITKTDDLRKLNEEIVNENVKVNPDVVVPNNTAEIPSNVKVQPTGYPIFEMKNFVFKIIDFKQTGNQFIVNMLVTYNGEQNQGEYIYCNKTRILDFDGNDYYAHWVQMGKNDEGLKAYHYDYIPGVPVKLRVVFNCTYSAKSIAAFEISTSMGTVQFKNISIAL